MPSVLPGGLILAACLEREDPRDVFISRNARSLSELPRGACLGTASLRRQAIAKRVRPDLRVVPLRGNVETRLHKLETDEIDATILALAGLKRLGLADRATAIMSAEEFLPAVGQGAIGIETREDNKHVRDVLARVDHGDTSTALACERAFLGALDGSCKTPIAGHATVAGDAVQFRGLIAHPEGGAAHDVAGTGKRKDAATIGAEAGRELKHRAGPGFFN
jgi:hydroxymethylbilane synthase